MVAFRHHPHHVTGKLALEQLEHRANLPRAFCLNRLPGGGLELVDFNCHVIEFGSTDNSLYATGPNLQVANRPVANVAPPARQAVGIVGKRLQVLTPALAPETPCDGASCNFDGLDLPAFFSSAWPFPDTPGRAARQPAHRDPERHHKTPQMAARVMSRRTKSRNASSESSVRLISSSPARMSSASCCFSAISRSIRSSTVPCVRNL